MASEVEVPLAIRTDICHGRDQVTRIEAMTKRDRGHAVEAVNRYPAR